MSRPYNHYESCGRCHSHPCICDKLCRCGYVGDDSEHPCHGRNYSCRLPAKARYYVPGPFSLAGAQLKVSATKTYACDTCWEEFKNAGT